MKSKWKKSLILGIFGFLIGFLILAYLNYLPSYCGGLPKCDEVAQEGIDCCPDVGNFKCYGFIQEESCSFPEYLFAPSSHILSLPLFILGLIIGYLISKKNEK